MFFSILFYFISNYDNQPIDNLSSSLFHVQLGHKFKLYIDNLPPNLVLLRFEPKSVFNRTVDHLPPSLKTLTFGACFNHPVSHLSLSLKQLTFGTNFNHPINQLPSSLTTLKFTHNSVFNQFVINLLSSLIKLSFRTVFNQMNLDHSLSRPWRENMKKNGLILCWRDNLHFMLQYNTNPHPKHHTHVSPFTRVYLITKYLLKDILYYINVRKVMRTESVKLNELKR
jgi:hypothetical protein